MYERLPSQKGSPQEAPKPPEFELWKEVISGAGISGEDEKKILFLLQGSQSRMQFLQSFADYLDMKNPDIFKHDEELKKQEALGLKPEVKLSLEDQTLLNLFREIRSDTY